MIEENSVDTAILAHSITISASYGSLEPIINWCKKFCINKWGYAIVESAGALPGQYKFYFQDMDDYINFTLWKK